MATTDVSSFTMGILRRNYVSRSKQPFERDQPHDFGFVK